MGSRRWRTFFPPRIFLNAKQAFLVVFTWFMHMIWNVCHAKPILKISFLQNSFVCGKSLILIQSSKHLFMESLSVFETKCLIVFWIGRRFYIQISRMYAIYCYLDIYSLAAFID